MKATRVYAYGCCMPQMPEATLSVVREQMRLAHKYRNTLVEIERARRAQYRELRSSLSPDLARLDAEYDRLDRLIVAKRELLSAVPKADRTEAPIAVEIRALKDERRAASEARRAERARVEAEYFRGPDEWFRAEKERRVAAENASRSAAGRAEAGPHTVASISSAISEEMFSSRAWPEPWKIKMRAEQAAQERARRARVKSGCHSGVYQAVEVAARKSFAESAGDPRFVRFEGRGKVGSQIIGRVSVKDAWSGQDRRLRIEALAGVHLRRGRGREAALCRVALGGRGEKTVWMEVPFNMHRALPEDARVSWVYLVCRRVGLDSVYELQFTVDVDVQDRVVPGGDRTIAVNLGWRGLKDGSARVATTWDGERVGPLLKLPADLREGFELSDRLIGYADTHFLAARSIAMEWWKDVSGRGVFPSETVDRLSLSTIAQWRSHGRLAVLAIEMRSLALSGVDARGLWKAWLSERLEAKKDLFAPWPELSPWLERSGVLSFDARVAVYLDFWQRKDRHLINWARRLKLRLCRRRRAIYGTFARDLASRYANVVVARWDKRDTAEIPFPEDDTRSEQEERASHNRFQAAVGELEDAIAQAFTRKHLVQADAARITLDHHRCGGESSDPLPEIAVTCSVCGQIYDQDVNAAKNLFSRGREQGSDEEGPLPARGGKKPRGGVGMRGVKAGAEEKLPHV